MRARGPTRPGRERPGQWAQALALSLALHGALAWAILDVLPGLTGPAPPAAAGLEIARLTLDPALIAGGEEGGGEGGLAPAETTLAPVPVPPAAVTPAPVTAAVPVAPLGVPVVNPPPLAPLAPAAAPPAPQAAAVAPVAPVTPPPGGTGTGTGRGSGAAVSDLARAIRDRLGDACLIALPEPEGADGLRLTVMAPLDQQIGDFLSALDRADLADRTTERSVLMDARQCPALAFARAAASYPVWPLAVRPDAPSVVDGGSVTGTVSGAGADGASLMLVDDDGVVQDLTRFTAALPGGLAFDVPVRRAGGARDTAQLLVAVAGRPRSLAALAGRRADQVFPALAAELGRGAVIGVAPFTIR